MRKLDELGNPSSCFQRAKEQEMIFVLLGRDAVAPATIRWWANLRVSEGKNKIGDAQIQEAFAIADTMERERGDQRGAS